MSVYRTRADDVEYGPIAITIIAVYLAYASARRVFAGLSVAFYGWWYKHASTIAMETGRTREAVMNAQIEAFATTAAELAMQYPRISMAVLPVAVVVPVIAKWYRLRPYVLAWFDEPLGTKAVQLGGLAALVGGYWWLLAHGYVDATAMGY